MSNCPSPDASISENDHKVTFIVGGSVPVLTPPISPTIESPQSFDDAVFEECEVRQQSSSSTSASFTTTVVISTGDSHEITEQKVTSSHRMSSVQITSNEMAMQKFEEQEQDFRGLFLTSDIMQEDMLRVSQQSNSHSESVTPTRPGMGIDHLDNLVRLMEQLSKLREDNLQLRRKVSYLEDTKALLMMRAHMVDAPKHRSTMDLADPQGFFHHQHTRAKSIISKQHTKIKQYLGTVPPKAHQALDKTTSDISEVACKAVLDVPRETTSPPKKLKSSRSMSVGSIEMVDLDLQNTVMELDTVKRHTSPSKSLVFRRGEFKASKKLQEKWERVKKVFGSRPEAQLGSMTAEQIVKINSKSSTRRPPSLSHMCSLDGTGTAQMDRLKPDDRVLSKSNPQLAEQPPHTPSSTQSEPPSIGPHPNSEQSEDEDSRFPFTPADKRHSCSSSSSSLASEEEDQVRTEFLQATANVRRSSSPTLGSQLSPTDLSPRISRSASFKLEGSRGEKRAGGTESVSVPSTPVGEQRKQSPFRNTDAHRKAKMAWGRVKNIIHNKRDLKLKKAKSSDDRDFEPDISSVLTHGSLSDSNICLEDEEMPRPATLRSPASGPSIAALAKEAAPSSPLLLPQMAQGGSSPRRLSPDPRSSATSPDRGKSPGSKRGSLAVAMTAGSPADVMALMNMGESWMHSLLVYHYA
jgi:hypothetical protein